MAAITKPLNKVFYQKIWVDGVYDLTEVIHEIREWFKANLYGQPLETENTTKVKGKGTETITKFKAEREVTDYIKFWIHIDGRAIEQEKVKVDDRILDKGKAEFKVKTVIELDYRKKWRKSKLGRILMFIYNNYLIKNKLKDVYEEKIYDEGFELFNVIKKTLNLYTA